MLNLIVPRNLKRTVQLEKRFEAGWEEDEVSSGDWRRDLPFCVSDKKEKACEQSVSTIPEEPEPVPYVLRGDDIQALAIKLEDLEKVCIFTHRKSYFYWNFLCVCMCLTEGPVHSFKPKPTARGQFSFPLACAAFYDLSDHQAQSLKVKGYWSRRNLFTCPFGTTFPTSWSNEKSILFSNYHRLLSKTRVKLCEWKHLTPSDTAENYRESNLKLFSLSQL